MGRNVLCLISGNKYIFSEQYYKKKIEEYGDVETLNKYFITKKVKSLLSRGYGVREIRNILNVDVQGLPDDTSQTIKDIVTYHSVKKEASNKKIPSFIKNKSDNDVAEFINNIKTLSL